MDLKIDRRGELWVKRGEKWRQQICPFRDHTYMCGEWCPLFGEPEPHSYHKLVSEAQRDLTTSIEFTTADVTSWSLQICLKTLTGQLTDERAGQGDVKSA